MNKDSIEISSGKFKYEAIDLATKKGKFNVEISRKILLDFKRVMDENNIFFGLIYGTLLGCIREGDLIEHDQDIDVFILDQDREKFLETLPILHKNNLLVCRYESDLLSVIRKDNYLDIYFFKKEFNTMKCCDYYVLESKFLLETKKYSFLGEEFNVPKDYIELLESIYGKQWKVPLRNVRSNYTQQIDFGKKLYSSIGLILKYVEKINNEYENIILYGNGSLTKVLSKFITIEFKIADIAILEDHGNLISLKNIDKYKYQIILITLIGREDEAIDCLIKNSISPKKVRQIKI